MNNKLIIPIRGMHCKSCEILIENNLKKINGIEKINVNYKTGKAEINYQGDLPKQKLIQKAVKEAGYEIGEKEKPKWISYNPEDYLNLLKAGAIILVIYAIGKIFGIFELNIDTESTSFGVPLLVGLVAGISTCMALIGGLVLGLSARHAEKHPETTANQKFRPHLFFNLGRILGYIIFGGLIGLIGTAFKFSSNILGILTILIGGVMIFFGLKLIEIFPVLKDKSITLPKSIAKIFGLDQEVKEYSHKSAMIMGGLTFFLPCGFTQAMQLYAVSTGSFVQGATIMGLFAIGTAPGLLGIGGLTSVFKGKRAKIFFTGAGIAVILLGWLNITSGKQLLGTSSSGNSDINNKIVSDSEYQEIKMTQKGSGYFPNEFTVTKNKPVKWIINSTNPYSCASSLVVPKLKISKDLQKGENIITFTPTQTGVIPFSCSMGMFTGKIIVK